MKDRLRSTEKAFTLIELLIVIAIIAILAAIVFVALNPLKRFQDSRDSARWADITSLVLAAKVDQVDNGGAYFYGINYDVTESLTVDGVEYMISNSTTTTGCNTGCSVIADANDCVNWSGLVSEGYLGRLPVAQSVNYDFDEDLTGYYFIKNDNDSITIGACEAEGFTTINITQ